MAILRGGTIVNGDIHIDGWTIASDGFKLSNGDTAILVDTSIFANKQNSVAKFSNNTTPNLTKSTITDDGSTVTIAAGTTTVNSTTVNLTGTTINVGNNQADITNIKSDLRIWDSGDISHYAHLLVPSVAANYTVTLPSTSGTLAAYNIAQTWVSNQTFDDADIILIDSSYIGQTFTGTTGDAYSLTANNLTSGAALRISSTSTGRADDSSLIVVTSSGTVAGVDVRGISSSVSNASASSIAYYASASGSSNNYSFYGNAGNILNKGSVYIISDNDTGQLDISRASDTDAYTRLGYHSGDYGFVQAVEAGTTYRPFILNPLGGDVGIGVTSPQEALHIKRNGAAEILLEGNDADIGIRFLDTANETWSIKSDQSNGSALTFAYSDDPATTPRMVIDSSGRVGINDTTPTYQLDVNGTMRATGAVTFDSTLSVTGEITGNASSATKAYVTADATSANQPIIFASGSGSNQSLRSNTNLTYNPNNGQLILTGGAFTGVLSGDVVAENAVNLTGANLWTVPYQSGAGVTSYVLPNTVNKKKWLRMTGTGSVGAAPVWDYVDTISANLTVDPNINVTMSSGAGTFTQSHTSTGATTSFATTHSGAKTSSFDAFLLQNIATSSTAGLTKRALRVASTGTWNGSSAINQAIYSQATGGTTNYSFYGDGGILYNKDAVDFDGGLDVAGNVLIGGTLGVTGAVALTGSLAIGTSLLPDVNDGATLGSSTVSWSDLFLASGAVINFNNGDVTLTHAANALTIAGGDVSISNTTASTSTATGALKVAGGVGVAGDLWAANVRATTAMLPDTNDGAVLGSATLQWSDLFLATGAVINFGNGNTTITHATDSLTISDNVYGTGFYPTTDDSGAVGSSAATWANGQFTNFTIDDTLSVRGAIDLADNDILRLGTDDDLEVFFDGSNSYIDLNVGNLIIRDGTTTKYTFADTGDLTVTGNTYAASMYLEEDANSSYYLRLYNNSALSANRTLTLNTNNADRTISLKGNLTLANSLTTSGNFALTLTTTAATAVTLPTSGTLATISNSETFTNKTLTSPDINGGTVDAITSLTVANNVDIGSYQLRASTFRSDVATGTAPFTVASTTKVTNLNADLLDGNDSTYYTNMSNAASGTLAVTRGGTGASSVTARYALLGPTSAAGAPTWRAVTSADISDATNTSTANMVVKRDGSGNFSAGTITAALSGNATTATTASKVAKSLVLKFDTGTTPDTNIYTFDGSAAKTINIKGGTNVTLTKAANTITISSTWRGIDDTPVNGQTAESISSNWAFDHNAGTGNGKHVPAAGSTGQFLAHNGAWATPPDTKYTHPAYTARASGLYKVTVNSTGHVSGATAVTKADITALGIPASDTNTTYSAGNGLGLSGTTFSIASAAGTAGSVGTINVTSTAIGVNLGTTSTTAFRGDRGNTAYNHVSSNGSSHSYINQAVTTTSSPTFAGMTLGTFSLSANGYTALPNGLLLQWGTFVSTKDGVETFYFPIAFSNAYQVVVDIEHGWGTMVYNDRFVFDRTDTIQGSTDARWVAIGEM